MNPIEKFFDAIFCINLDRSPHRWEHAMAEAKKGGFEKKMQRFRGFEFHDWDKFPDGIRSPIENSMCGCSHSHAGILHVVRHFGWKHVLVLEDDFEILHDDFLDRFTTAVAELPSDWDILYLGAHYGTVPTERFSEHLVRGTNIKTTSSYGITGKHAGFIAPVIGGTSGPDDVLSGYNPHVNAFVVHPRLMGQYECVSDIWGNVTNNTLCMTDKPHDRAVEALKY